MFLNARVKSFAPRVLPSTTSSSNRRRRRRRKRRIIIIIIICVRITHWCVQWTVCIYIPIIRVDNPIAYISTSVEPLIDRRFSWLFFPPFLRFRVLRILRSVYRNTAIYNINRSRIKIRPRYSYVFIRDIHEDSQHGVPASNPSPVGAINDGVVCLPRVTSIDHYS